MNTILSKILAFNNFKPFIILSLAGRMSVKSYIQMSSLILLELSLIIIGFYLLIKNLIILSKEKNKWGYLKKHWKGGTIGIILITLSVLIQIWTRTNVVSGIGIWIFYTFYF